MAEGVTIDVACGEVIAARDDKLIVAGENTLIVAEEDKLIAAVKDKFFVAGEDNLSMVAKMGIKMAWGYEAKPVFLLFFTTTVLMQQKFQIYNFKAVKSSLEEK